MKKIFRPFLIVFFSAISIITLFGTLSFLIPQPPVEKVTEARKTLGKAKTGKAGDYAIEKLTLAQNLYDSLMLEWANQNRKLFFRRDYTGVSSLANQTIDASNTAAHHARDLEKLFNTQFERRIAELKDVTSRFDSVFAGFPFPPEIKARYAKGKILLSEASRFYTKEKLTLCNERLAEAEEKISIVAPIVHQKLTDYFAQQSDWINLVNTALKESRVSGGELIIVEKIPPICKVYKAGKLTASFQAELGVNWIGDKHYKGDKATPEGKYRVVKKLDKKHTIYHRALLINYPNQEDELRFNAAIAKGSLSEKADIGGLIEIHGEGGKGYHWTDGCVALANRDMESLFAKVGVGTPVIIIGSLKDYSELFPFLDEEL